MATHTDPAAPRSPEPAGKLVEYEEYIEAQLDKTRSHVRSVDIAGSLMTLCAGTVAYFFLAAVIDHWVIPGGLGFWGRLTILSLFVVAALGYLFVEVLPLLVRRINPVYAAQTIERSRPTLKNGLVNFLFFRDNPAGLNQAVYEAIEEQAAIHLAKDHVDVAVDRTKLIRIGYALVGMVSICALYALLSPKDLFKTVSRVVMPWAEISAPTRAAIDEVEPGDTRAFRGQQVAVFARVLGVPSDAKVMLYYTTSDGQTVDRPVEMQLGADGYKHTCTLPAGESSLQQSLEYRIEAGDAVTRKYRLEVVAAPTLVVRSFEYKYPTYTGLLAQRVEHQGDLKALEGTEVTLEAIANQKIESAHIDFDCDKTLDQRMQADDQQAKATFRLKLKDDRKTPEHGSYELVFSNDQGQQNPQPVRHQIEVIRDLSPEIQFVSPKKDEIDLPVNGAVELEIVASDPDFALRLVKLSATSGKQPLLDKILLDEVWRGQWVRKFRIEPSKLGLKVGDVVEYSAAVEDNKNPRPNRTETGKRRIRIVSPSAQDRNQDQLAQKGQQGDGKQAGDEGQRGGDDEHPRDKNDQPAGQKPSKEDQAKPDGDNQGENQDAGPQDEPSKNVGPAGADQKQGEQGEPSTGKPGASGQKGDKSSEQGTGQGVPNDGSDDGGAFEQILKRREEQTKGSEKSSNQKSSDKQQLDEKQSADQEPNDRQQPGEEQGQDGQQKSAGAKKQPDAQRGQRPKADEKQQEPQTPKEGEAGEKPSDGAGQQPDGDKQGAEDSKASEKPSREQPDKSDRKQPQNPKGPEKGSEKGVGSSGGDAGDQQQDQSGQQGGKGQQKKGSSGGKGQQQGESSDEDSATQDNSGQDGKGKDGKSAGAKSGDKPGDDNADANQNGQPQGQKNQGTKPAGNKKPTADKSESNEGDPSSPMKPDGKSDPRGKSQGEKPNGEKPNPRDADPAASDSDDAKPGEKPNGKADQSQSKPNKRATDDGDKAMPDESDPAGNAKQGQGAQSKGEQPPRDANRKSSQDKNSPDAEPSAEEKEKGESGAGQAGQDTKGSPSPQKDQQPTRKSPSKTPDEKDPKKDGDQPQSPSTSQRESNSEGIDDGDRSGGGKKGGGQKANKSGTGGPGQNTAADEGSGRSDEAGQGETSNRAGGDRESSKKTGQSGSKPGEGSDSKATGQGDKPGGGAPQENSAAGQDGQPAGNEQPGKPGAPSGGQPGGGKPSDGSADQQWKPGQDEAEAANLQYARKATDLALEHLKNELRKDKPDPELLKRLGWTPKDLENFVQRWEQMRKQSQAPGDKGKAAQRELDESLRSLGLRPRSTSLKANSARDDQTRGVKESRRSSPPAEYSEQYKSYIQGTAKGGK